jgi:hypothetical protein
MTAVAIGGDEPAVPACVDRARSPFENRSGSALAPSAGNARLLRLRANGIEYPLVLSLSKHERRSGSAQVSALTLALHASWVALAQVAYPSLFFEVTATTWRRW